jgi:hypothetical protein
MTSCLQKKLPNEHDRQPDFRNKSKVSSLLEANNEWLPDKVPWPSQIYDPKSICFRVLWRNSLSAIVPIIRYHNSMN